MLGIRFLVLILLVLGVGIRSAGAQGPVDKGKQLFAAQKCGMCHSVAGKGNPKGPLDAAGKKWSAEELRQWLVAPDKMAAKANAQRKPPMKSYASLSKDDIEALVAYLQTLKG